MRQSGKIGVDCSCRQKSKAHNDVFFKPMSHLLSFVYKILLFKIICVFGIPTWKGRNILPKQIFVTMKLTARLFKLKECLASGTTLW